MCRIIGLYSHKKIAKTTLVAMRDALAHGGPDAVGAYIDEEGKVALGHRRLAVLGLSELGIQPMYWNDWVICYNGEVYNFEEIKQRLPQCTFTTGTDTEVILKAFETWGFDCVKQFRGMFAFALYNKKTKKLILCRDRIGVKPLYWYQKDELFMFASELKAFHKHPDFDKTINQKAVSLYLQQGYIPAPYAIFKYAHKLEPGYFLEINTDQQVKKIKYWDAKEVYTNRQLDERKEEEIVEELETILSESFKLRMVSDVPVGMFLSGGIDSSMVTALLQKQYNHSLKTFTIGFDDKKRNEAEYAKKIAQHLGTDHTELYCTEQDARDIIPRLADIYDEPFGDSSGIPTYLVAKLAREQVTVSLSADGGDELFGGYTKYEFTKKYHNSIGRLPNLFKKGTAKLVNGISPSFVETYGSQLPLLRNYKDLELKFSKFQNALNASDIVDFFNVSSSYLSPQQLKKFHPALESRFKKNGLDVNPDRIYSLLGMIDIKTFLEGDIMTKVDRATMQVALEGREPFLDHHIIEFSQSIPDSLKLRDGKAKYILRTILYKHVPKELIERPKMGFSIPIEEWLHSILAERIAVIKEDALFFEVFQLNAATIEETIDTFLSKKQYVNPHFIWFVFILHQWYERWMK